MGLETRRVTQHTTELHIFRRGQRFQHRPLFKQQALDLLHPGQDLEAVAELILLHQSPGCLQFMQHQFHPQFRSLVLYNKQHFIMMLWVGKWLLTIQ